MGLKGSDLLGSFALIAEDTRKGPSAEAQAAFNRLAAQTDDPAALKVYAQKHGYQVIS